MFAYLSFLAAGALAPEPNVQVPGLYLWSACTIGHEAKLYEQLHAYCLAYVSGVADMEGVSSGGQRRQSSVFCVPQTVDAEGLAAIVARFSDNHIDLRSAAAVNLVTLAVREAFPCPPK